MGNNLDEEDLPVVVDLDAAMFNRFESYEKHGERLEHHIEAVDLLGTFLLHELLKAFTRAGCAPCAKLNVLALFHEPSFSSSSILAP